MKPLRKKSSIPAQVSVLLLPWYRRERRRLPWRNEPNPYQVWISEVMLQQTRVETVIPYYDRFLARFPTVEALAAAPMEDVLAAWSGLGYYRRARSLHAAALAIVERHRGCFPRRLEEALEIPGVGTYTAGAVLSIAYNLPLPVVDGNVERVLTRLLRIGGSPRQAENARRLREIARGLIPAGEASDFNQALMELGATICTPSSPACERCPLEGICAARLAGDIDRYPEAPRPQRGVDVRLQAAVLRSGQRYLLERVTRGKILRGLWLFPIFAGVVSEGSIRAALSRRLEVPIVRVRLMGSVRHAITYRRIRMDVYHAEARHGLALEPAVPECADLRWARLEDLGKSLPVSSLALKVAKLIAAESC